MKAAMYNDNDAGPAAANSDDDDADATVDLGPCLSTHSQVLSTSNSKTLSAAVEHLETSSTELQPPPPQADDTRDITTDNGQ